MLPGILASAGAKPGTPTIGTATAGEFSASVAFTAPSYTGKGGTVTYVATSSPGGFTGSSTTSPITVTGLSAGTAYTFTVQAQTSYGVNSDSSSASNSVTPTSFIVQYYTSSSTYTPSSYPATLTIYAIGGGGGMGSYQSSGTKNIRQFSLGGGGGGGFYSTASGVVVNSGSVTVTVGAGGTFPGAEVLVNGNTGGTSSTSVGGVSAAGGSGGAYVNGASSGGGTGGAGGSGGGAGGGYQFDIGAQSYNWEILAGNGGSGGANGKSGTRLSGSTGTIANGGAGTGGASASGGGGGGSTQQTPTAGAYNGINISGTNYGSGRGVGAGGGYGSYTNNGIGGFVIIQRTA